MLRKDGDWMAAKRSRSSIFRRSVVNNLGKEESRPLVTNQVLSGQDNAGSNESSWAEALENQLLRWPEIVKRLPVLTTKQILKAVSSTPP